MGLRRGHSKTTAKQHHVTFFSFSTDRMAPHRAGHQLNATPIITIMTQLERTEWKSSSRPTSERVKHRGSGGTHERGTPGDHNTN